MVTFNHNFSTQKSSTHHSNCNPNHQAQQKKQPQPHSDPATTLVTAKVGRRAMYQLHKHTTTIESVTRCLTLSSPPLPRSYHHQAALSPTTTNAYLGLCISIELTFVVIPYIYNIGTKAPTNIESLIGRLDYKKIPVAPP
jgi:hypothetical protein